ncbi:hypothetical protein EVAR_52857_1 [Eumeta japonica]|uniref:Uncharacterized protein n=1 Tax=Eumeta variegata TaxID=151549 RepID=A0A4C1YAI9_EUMVA|nr:hypothetical protein EVAR_52857_1 [Eumeta japonica]
MVSLDASSLFIASEQYNLSLCCDRAQSLRILRRCPDSAEYCLRGDVPETENVQMNYMKIQCGAAPSRRETEPKAGRLNVNSDVFSGRDISPRSGGRGGGGGGGRRAAP